MRVGVERNKGVSVERSGGVGAERSGWEGVAGDKGGDIYVGAGRGRGWAVRQSGYLPQILTLVRQYSAQYPAKHHFLISGKHFGFPLSLFSNL